MKNCETSKIRNLALVGHSASGKTTLAESLLYKTGVIKRLGSVADGTTVSDYEKQEIKRQNSIQTSIIPIENNGYKINLIDAPGFFDFEVKYLTPLEQVSLLYL